LVVRWRHGARLGWQGQRLISEERGHHDRGLSVAVLLRPGAPAGITTLIRTALAAGLAGAGAVPPPISVTPVDHIDQEGGLSGKFTVVRSLRHRPVPAP